MIHAEDAKFEPNDIRSMLIGVMRSLGFSDVTLTEDEEGLTVRGKMVHSGESVPAHIHLAPAEIGYDEAAIERLIVSRSDLAIKQVDEFFIEKSKAKEAAGRQTATERFHEETAQERRNYHNAMQAQFDRILAQTSLYGKRIEQLERELHIWKHPIPAWPVNSDPELVAALKRLLPSLPDING